MSQATYRNCSAGQAKKMMVSKGPKVRRKRVTDEQAKLAADALAAGCHQVGGNKAPIESVAQASSGFQPSPTPSSSAPTNVALRRF